MILNTGLISFLEKFLGRGQRRGGSSWYVFKCPFCKHEKLKFGVDIATGNHHYKCFICGTKGPSMESLGFRLRLNQETKSKLVEIAPNKHHSLKPAERVVVPFPEAYRPLSEYQSFKGWDKRVADGALRYMIDERGMNRIDILRHQIGICSSGPFSNRLIIPSFDEFGLLNDFSARKYDPKNEWGPTYVGPKIDRSTVIPFANQINWKLPIRIVEGYMDAIATRRNAIPLGGKYISHALEVALARPEVGPIYLILDNDALTRVHELARYYMSLGKTVYAVELPDKDPSKLGFDAVNRLVFEAKPFDYDQDLYLSFKSKARLPIYSKEQISSTDYFADNLRTDLDRWFAKAKA